MPIERRIQDVTHTSFYGENPNRNRYLSYIKPRYSPTDHDLFVNDLSDPKRVRNLVSTVKRRQEEYWGQPFDHRMRMETDVHSPSYYTYMAYIYGKLPHDKWCSIIQGNTNKPKKK